MLDWSKQCKERIHLNLITTNHLNFRPHSIAQSTCSLLEAGMALPAGVFDLLYGEEDELQDSGDDMDKDECGSPLRWG